MNLNKLKWIWIVITGMIILPLIILAIYIFRPWNRICRKTCRVLFWLHKINVEKIGEFDLSADILILNHQSMVDIIYLEAFHPKDICWVAKKELGEMFLYKYALKGPRMILVDRESKKSLVLLLKEAKQKIDEGRVLSIFPEGTRSKGEEEFLEFKNGAKILIEKFKLKVQPIVLVNTRKLFDHSKYEVISNHAKAICMEAYYPNLEDKNWYENLKNNMFSTYKKHYEELNGKLK